MAPIIQILLAMSLAVMALHGELPAMLELGGVGVVTATALLVAALIPIAWWCENALRRAYRGTYEADRPTRDRAARSHMRIIALFRMMPFGLFATIVLVVGWPGWIGRGPLRGTILLDDAAALAPFGALLVLSWLLQYRLERRRLRDGVSAARFVGFHARQILLPVAPVVFAVLVFDLLMASPTAIGVIGAFPFLSLVIVFVILGCVYLASGPLLRLTFGAQRLPDGPLRDRLTAFAAETGVGYRDLLVWPTGMGLINAAIVGACPPLRYVLFTEGMLEQFDDDEIVAVFAHELGHARGAHIHLYFLFAGSLVFLWQAAFAWFGDGLTGIEQYALFAVIVVIYWRAVFGVVSRTFEREADFLGASSVGDPQTFIGALESVARRSGTARTQPSWRHYSIAERADFLARAFADEAVRERFRARVRVVKALVVATFVASAAYAARDVGIQIRAGRGVLHAIDTVRDAGIVAARREVDRLMADPAVRGHAAVAAASQPVGGLEAVVAADILLRAAGPLGFEDVETALRFEAAAAMHLRRVVEEGLADLRDGDVDGARERLRTVLEYTPIWQSGLPFAQDRIGAWIEVFRGAVRAALATP